VVSQLSQDIQEVTGAAVQVAWVDQGYTGEEAAQAAGEHGIELIVVKIQEAKRGFVLLPRRWVPEDGFQKMGSRRWVVERSFA